MLTQDFNIANENGLQTIKNRRLGDALMRGTPDHVKSAIDNGADVNGMFISSVSTNIGSATLFDVAVDLSSVDKIIIMLESNKVDFKKSSRNVVERYLKRPERDDDYKYALSLMSKQGADFDIPAYDYFESRVNTLSDRLQRQANNAGSESVKQDRLKMLNIVKFYKGRTMAEFKSTPKSPETKA